MRCLRGVLLVMTVVAALGASVPASAQTTVTVPDLTAWLGRNVTVVRIEIEGRVVDEPNLIALLELRPGAPLRDAEVRESLRHLGNLGRFDTATLSATADGSGVAVRFSLMPRHPIERVEFRGTLGLDRRTLERAVIEQVGGRVTAIRMEAAAESVRRALADEGFYRPTVVPSVEQVHEVHRSTVVLTVEAGPRQRIGSVSITGQSPLTQDALMAAVDIGVGTPYRRREIEDRLREVAEGLRARRYYEASASHFATGEAEVVELTITVDAGPIVDIVIVGEPLPPGGVDQWIPIRRENSADEDLLEDASFRISRALQREGYWRARVTVQRVEDPAAARMVVNVDVRRGRRYRLRDVTIAGNTFFPSSDVRGMLALKFGEPFDDAAVIARVAALRDAYALAGFSASIDIIPEALPTPDEAADGDVVVHLTIAEGPARTVGRVVVTGASQVQEAELRRVIRSVPGQPLRDMQVRQDRDAVEAVYRNAGFQNATVVAALTDAPAYTVTFTVVEGLQTFVDHIIVVGNERVATQTILGRVTLRSGQPLGLAARVESQRRLNEMAIFRRVSITQAPGGPDASVVDVIIQVEESDATTIGYGGGLEFGRRVRTVEGGVADRFELAPRGFLELGRRNLFGGNRSVNLFTRVSLRPANDPDDPDKDGKGLAFSEYRVTGSYREARALRSDTALVVSATAERAIRTSFTFVRRAVNAEALRRVSGRTSVFGRYALDSTRLFDTRIEPADQPLIDRLFPQIRLSSISSGLIWDKRDDLLDPTSGGWLSADAELAARSIGSEVGFAKAFFQATGFRRITRAYRVVIAGRAQVGLARGFEREVVRTDLDGAPVLGSGGEPIVDIVADLPAGRRFFAGGSTSVRGFQQDRLGVPGILDAAGLSNGGNALVVMNAEVRTQVFSAISVVGFVDGGNVFARLGDIAPSAFRGAAGLGVRYRSPLGPLRLDFGFKFDRRMLADKRERRWEFHLSIGEAF
jgi:outer membrane protein assembly factor BamA